MEVENNVINISLGTLVKIFWKRAWILILVAALCFAGLFLYSKLTYEEQYQSTGRMYIIRQIGAEEDRENADYQVSLLVVKDCMLFLKDRSVLEQVIANLQNRETPVLLNESYESLSRRISVSNDEETSVIYITVTADTPEEAKLIVDEIGEVGVLAISGLLGENQAKYFGKGELPKNPCNAPSITMMILISMAAMLLVYALFVIIHHQNEHIGSAEEIEKRLRVAVLGEIPDAKKLQKGGRIRRYFSKYGKYADRYQYGYGYGYGYVNRDKNEEGGEESK